MLGYHGLSVRPTSQRQSGTAGSSSQVGRPSAPARWATLVSTVTTRSQFASRAAVSEKSVRRSPSQVMAWPAAPTG